MQMIYRLVAPVLLQNISDVGHDDQGMTGANRVLPSCYGFTMIVSIHHNCTKEALLRAIYNRALFLCYIWVV